MLVRAKRKAWLERFVSLPNGIPSHDAFERLFARLDPFAFQRCFTGWMQTWHAKRTGKHLAIDGKSSIRPATSATPSSLPATGRRQPPPRRRAA